MNIDAERQRKKKKQGSNRYRDRERYRNRDLDQNRDWTRDRDRDPYPPRDPDGRGQNDQISTLWLCTKAASVKNSLLEIDRPVFQSHRRIRVELLNNKLGDCDKVLRNTVPELWLREMPFTCKGVYSLADTITIYRRRY
ncbi:hypothetical protein EVAR_2739_1 [Eumeta japonica]|uniref:Uncharacterized protein n=1 Tax=Eumeta variegata TaxID=151549 RepID=A0A4C1T075_EUMVA|nr:hypothetical protein EVAR_2739_1 [Eumeta japonica]